MDATLIGNANKRPDNWLVLAELPFNDLAPVYAEMRKLRHAICGSFDPSTDNAISFYYRGYKFRAAKRGDHIDMLVSEPDCPADILFEPLAKLIPPLTRCSLKSHHEPKQPAAPIGGSSRAV
ncbi:MAG: hypothetical protein JNL18_02660 [Planctomycetaceae bacterium]|uniref:Uncharacterized protein n=1 Tax=Lacipirellula limnantheis TaxID=2528024 RepID=A0A517TYX4_9BACT|nr:hypothetical protein [Lacipirellula limnantheis]MBL9161624.1 hypothetical protein [Planctomycetaceae bacterium]QDT73572.1 hypothetical protein I41_27610 [Lacipirellula limnantheis]